MAESSIMLETVYEPLISCQVQVDIVAVSCVHGRSHWSWKTDGVEQDHSVWLRDLLPRHIPAARVMLYSYNCGTNDTTTLLSAQGLEDSAEDLLDRLSKSRQNTKENTPIVFMGHDLGMIIVKKALVLSAQRVSALHIAKFTPLLVCFGTPHRADGGKSWNEVIYDLVQNSDCPFSMHNKLSNLQEFAECTAKTSNELLEHGSSLRRVNIYQKENTRLANVVLGRYSATTDFIYDTNIWREALHQKLCNITGDNDTLFRTIVAAILLEIDINYSQCLSTLRTLAPGFNVPCNLGDDELHPFRGQNEDVMSHYIHDSRSFIVPVRGGSSYYSKSVSGALLRRLQQGGSVATYYAISAETTCLSLILSLVRQVLSQSPTCFFKVRNLLQSITREAAWTERAVLPLFKLLLDSEGVDNIFLVLYDVHRCSFPWRDLFYRLINRKRTEGSLTNFKIIVFGLDESNFSSLKVDTGAPILQIISQTLIKESVIYHGKHSVSRLIRKRPHIGSLRPVIEEALSRCQTPFELSYTLHTAADYRFGNLLTLRSAEAKIESLPSPVLGIVLSAYNALSPWGKTTLGWILNAQRPLRLSELAITATFFDAEGNITADFNDRDLPLSFSDDLYAEFGPLLVIGVDDCYFDQEVEQLLRDAVDEERQNYERDKKPQPLEIPGHWEITRSLLGYLSSSSIMEPLKVSLQQESWEIPDSAILDLVHYAVQSWPTHYKKSESSRFHIEEVTMFLQYQPFTSMWSEVRSRFGNHDSPSDLCVVDPLLLSALHGFDDIMQHIGWTDDHSIHELAISLASWGGNITSVKKLLDSSVDTAQLDLTRSIANASVRGHDEIVRLLIDCMNKSRFSWHGGLLGHAAELGFEDQVSLFLQEGAFVDLTYNETTPLQFAAKNGHASIVNYLLSKHANIDSKNAENPTKPLLYASSSGHTQVVRDLFEHEPPADITLCDSAGSSAFHLASEHGHTAIMILLLDQRDKLDKRYDLDLQDDNGRSALMLASTHGHLAIVNLLLDQSVTVDLTDRDQHTAPYKAVSGRHEATAKVLLEHCDPGANLKDLPDIIFGATKLGYIGVLRLCLEMPAAGGIDLGSLHDDDGRGLLHYASENGHADVASLLLSIGVPIDQKTKKPDNVSEGLTAITLAALAGMADVVSLLFQNGADFKTKNSNGWNLLAQIADKTGSQTNNGHVKVTEMLLKAGVGVDDQEFGYPRRSALHLAARSGNVEIARVLLNFGADPNLQNADGHNALHYGASRGHRSIIQLVLGVGVNPLGKDNSGLTAMHWAAQINFIDIMEDLYRIDPETVLAEDYDGASPLHVASEKAAATEWLIEHGADVNAQDRNKETPLMRACETRCEDVVEVLLNRGADRNIKDEEGQTALHHAAYFGSVNVGSMLLRDAEPGESIINIQDRSSSTALHISIFDDEPDFAMMLLEEKFRPQLKLDLKDEDGDTPLLLAVMKDYIEIIQCLLLAEADPEVRNNDGDNALSMAVREGRNMVRTLLFDYADINAGGGKYPTVLYIAAEQGLLEVVEELLDHGANVNGIGGMCNTALTAAALSGFEEVVRKLLSCGAEKQLGGGIFPNAMCAALCSDAYDIVPELFVDQATLNQEDLEGRTSVHIASWQGTWDLFEELEEEGANLSAKDRQGRTILHHAAATGNAEVVEKVLSMEKLTDFNVSDHDGWTPLHWACRNEDNSRVIELLLEKSAELPKTTTDGWSLSDIAIFHDNEDLLDLLRTEIDSNSKNESPDKTMLKRGTCHSQSSCDSCRQKPIYGIRWKCKDCSNFELCFKCYWCVKDAHYNHDFESKGDGPRKGPEYEEQPAEDE